MAAKITRYTLAPIKSSPGPTNPQRLPKPLTVAWRYVQHQAAPDSGGERLVPSNQPI